MIEKKCSFGPNQPLFLCSLNTQPSNDQKKDHMHEEN